MYVGVDVLDQLLADLRHVAGACRRGRLFESRLRAAIQRSGRTGALSYLTAWRMRVAAGLLLDGTGIRTVASRVGYRSEAAFYNLISKYGCVGGRHTPRVSLAACFVQ